MHTCHEIKAKAGLQGRCIALVGNPNVGKTALFNALTGTYADVSNFPGTTVEIVYHALGEDLLLDTPGVYGLSSFTAAEKLTREVVASADMVINVVSALHLERDLFLTLHLIDAGLPLVVVLNMVDEAAARKVAIDHRVLAGILGVPVVPAVAVEKRGISDILAALPEARVGKAPQELLLELADVMNKHHTSRLEALLWLEEDQTAVRRLGQPAPGWRDRLYMERRHRVNEIVCRLREQGSGQKTAVDWLGHWLIHPVTGIPFLILTLAVLYHLVGVIFAGHIVDYTEGVLMERYYQPVVRQFLSQLISPASVPGEILGGEFGLLTMAVTYLLGLLLPLVVGFFLALALLEDSGYLPRIAILMDRAMAGLGLNGLAIIPLVLGFGCVTMAAITTRLLPGERERRIAIFLLVLAVPCSAQLAFVAAVLSGLGPAYLVLYVLIVLSVLTVAGRFLARVLPGQSQPLWVDLPVLRWPRLANVFIKTWQRTRDFMREAVPIFMGGALLLGILKVSGWLAFLHRALQPVTVSWLHLPPETASAFIMGFIRRDFGTAGILHINLTTLQQFVALVTLTLFVPCIASAMVIFKERGWREGTLMWLTVISLAFFSGGIITRGLEFLLAFWPNTALWLASAALLLLLLGPALFGLSDGGGKDF
ncbi:ferrous iron transport protein B [Desulfurispora thermophila]|uniref:ferrous iron transport protein B n=1 Tax=Desulfurispora thermophila TaxID=265470 RepID=UPI000375A3E2|nr:ferrous iron transport protein B [Desulfurispora thermophila]